MHVVMVTRHSPKSDPFLYTPPPTASVNVCRLGFSSNLTAIPFYSFRMKSLEQDALKAQMVIAKSKEGRKRGTLDQLAESPSPAPTPSPTPMEGESYISVHVLLRQTHPSVSVQPSKSKLTEWTQWSSPRNYNEPDGRRLFFFSSSFANRFQSPCCDITRSTGMRYFSFLFFFFVFFNRYSFNVLMWKWLLWLH